MKKMLAILGIGAAITLTPGAVASGHSDTSVQLSITPRLCVVDVIQDGTSQLLQSPSPDCQGALPTLLANPLNPGGTSPLFALPFAGRDSSRTQQPLIRPRVDGQLVPIASKAEQTSGNTTGRLAMTMTGVGLATAAVAVGIDIALFELHYSKSLAKWTRAKTADRVFKK